MNSKSILLTLSFTLAILTLFVAARSSGSSRSSFGSNSAAGTQDGNLNVTVTDASGEDWATVGVKILSISLIPQGSGSNVSVYNTTQGSTPIINLVQLDELREILAQVAVPVGAYAGAVVTISGNPTDIQLTTTSAPSFDFVGTAGANVPSSQIEVRGATGAAGNLTVPVTVKFSSPLVVTANKTSALDLEFGLSDAAFLVGRKQAGSLTWAINFTGPLHQYPVSDITWLLLRDVYGDVSTSATDGSSLTITRVFPFEPAAASATAETAVASTYPLQIFPDATNGTSFYDVDAKTGPVTVKSFSTLASSLNGKYVRIAARYQADGTLVAVRLWSGKTFGSLYAGPEGHILRVNKTANTITVQNEIGQPVTLTVNGSTQFFFRTPSVAAQDAAPVGKGPDYLENLDVGYKIHASVNDPSANPLVAQTVDVESQTGFGIPASDGQWPHRTVPSQFEGRRPDGGRSIAGHVADPLVSSSALLARIMPLR